MKNIISEVITKDQAQKMWDQLSIVCDMIFEQRTNLLSFQEIYQLAYKLVLNKHGEYLYEQLKNKICRLIDRLIQPLTFLREEQLLIDFVKSFEDMQCQIKLISGVMLYVEKNFILTKQFHTIKSLFYENFKQRCFENDQKMSSNLLSCFISQIRHSRNQELIEHNKLKNALQILIDLNQSQHIKQLEQYNFIVEYQTNEDFYRNYFERRLLQESNKTFREDSQIFINQLTIEEYIIFVQKKYDNEIKRVNSYVPKTSHQKILDGFIKNYITLNFFRILEELVNFIEQDKFHIIIKMFHLFTKSEESFDHFVKKLNMIVIEKLQDLNQNENTLDGFIKIYQKLFKLYDQLAQHGTDLQMDKCRKAITSSFEVVINRDYFIMQELNKYFDKVLKNDNYKDEERVELISKGFEMFKFINSKDEFEQIYRQYLSQRLLDQAYISYDYEKSMVQKFKTECGYVLTQKMETMLTDLQTSNQESQEFGQRQNLQIELDVKVLTSEQWPLHEKQVLCIHEDLLNWQQQFTQFYQIRKPKRKLSFYYTLGSVNLKAIFPNSKHDFVCSVTQATILLYFNKQRIIPIDDLLKLTNIEFNQLNFELDPFLQYKLIIQENGTLSLNMAFQNRKYKICMIHKKPHIIASGQKSKIKQQEICVDTKEIMFDRKIYLESLIVKVLKTKKQLEHKDLFGYIEKDAKTRHFLVEMQFFKECIENLIQKDYLYRKEGRLDLYIYKA